MASSPTPSTSSASGAARDLVGAVGGDGDAKDARAAVDDQLELRLAVEIKPHRDAEAVAQRIGEQPGTCRGADQGEFGKVDLHRACRRAFTDDEVELKILHRRIKDFLDRRVEAMDLVDEENVAIFEIGEQRREIAGLADPRA